MAESNKMKIRDLAKTLNTSNGKIVEKLAEIGITKSAAGSLDEDELRRFYEHTGNKRGLDQLDNNGHEEVKDESQQPAKAVSRIQRQNTSSGKSNGFVIGRVVKKEESSSYSNYSSDDRNKTAEKQKKSEQNIGSSDLRSGYVTRRGANDYSGYLSNVQKPKKPENDTAAAQPEPAEEQKTEPAESRPQTVVRKVKRVVSSVAPETKEQPAEKKAEEEKKPEEKQEIKAAEKAEPAPQEKAEHVKEEKTSEEKEPAPAAEEIEKKETAKEEQVKEAPVKEEKTEPVKKYTEQKRPDERKPFLRQRDDSKPSERQQSFGKNQDYQRDRSQGQQGGRPFRDQYQGQRNGERPAQRQYDKPFERKDDRNFDKKDDKNFERGGERKLQGNGQGRPSQRIPSVPSEVAVEEERKRRPADNTFNKLNKKEKQESAAARSQNSSVSSKDKYQSARQYIGEKKGVSEVYSDDFSIDMENPKYGSKGKKEKKNKNKQEFVQRQPVAVLTNVKLPETMTVKEFAEAIKKSVADVIKKMFMMGTMASQNEVIGFDTAEIIASEFGITAEKEVVVSVEEQIIDDSDDANDENAVARPPVVVVMGHVDHGKTSLLDAIRSTSVTAGEAGGITQHIGAYTVKIKGRNITFLDTPGHEAFTAMRARGAMVTDVAILVVAADDGVKPQTIEAINHAKAAKVSIVVAVNKMDKEGANLEKVRQELAEHEVVCEEWGGDVPFIPVSAKKHENIELLLETVLLSADILDLKANPDKQAKGTIIEAKLDKNKGPVATLLVQRGTLKQGDLVLSGTVFGKIRTMSDDKGNSIKKAGPSTPVEITGLPEVPEAGELFYAVEDEHKARQVAEQRKSSEREKMIHTTSKVSLDDLFNQIHEGQMKELNIIVKADVQGSVEAVKQSLEKLSNDEVKIKTIHGAVGAINESDVTLASVSNAIIIGFNVRPVAGISEHAESLGVDMRLYRVIYDAIDDIKAAMAGMLEPEFKEVAQGTAEIRQIYKVSGIGSIAGCYVTTGKIVRNSNVRIVRNGIVVYEGKLASLKRFKDDAKEVAMGFECGMSFERYNDIKEQDVVECYTMEEIKRA